MKPTGSPSSSIAALRPGMQRRMRRRHEAARDSRREQRLEVALDVEEVDRALGLAPLQRLAPGRRRGRRAAAAGERPRRRSGPPARCGSRRKTLAELEHAHARRLAREVDACSTSTRLPTRLERITDIGCAIGLSDADRLGVAGEVALPALVDEAEIDRLLLAERRPARGAALAGAATRLAAARAPSACRAAARRRQPVVAEHADHLLDQVFLDRAGRSASSAASTVIAPGVAASHGEAEASHHALAFAPASPACRSPWRRARRAASPASRVGSADDVVVDRAAARLAPPQISTISCVMRSMCSTVVAGSTPRSKRWPASVEKL